MCYLQAHIQGLLRCLNIVLEPLRRLWHTLRCISVVPIAAYEAMFRALVSERAEREQCPS